MKKIFKYLFIGMFGVLCLSSCSNDMLETEPTDAMSGSTFMSDASKALVPLNGIYRSMYTAGWSTTGNTHQCFGISAYNLMAEVMGDDMIMGASGSGWFWYDAAYDVKDAYDRSTWRSYDLWMAYYTWVANANYIIAAEETMGGLKEDVDYVIGQAYAIRAYSYFMLAQSFARTYKGHEDDPCVPLYNEPTMTTTTGQPRAKVSEVYAQIDSDINKAIELLANSPAQRHPSHISYAVALGLKSRIALVEEKWDVALDAAQKAITASGKSVQPVDASVFAPNKSNFVNSVGAGNVMWGAQIVSDQAGMYASLMTHMSGTAPYGQRAPKCITPWLYSKLGEKDSRRATYTPAMKDGEVVINEETGDTVYAFVAGWWDPQNSYQQKKFEFSNEQTWEGDYIWMRVEEMYFTAAEAACRLGQEATAKEYLMDVMSMRDPNYDTAKTGTALGKLTTQETYSLLEEILIQRRIELWGEDGRIYTIRRLRQGFERPSSEGWPAGLRSTDHVQAWADPESYSWVMTIPQAEFDGNVNMNPNPIPKGDQNPIGDYPE